MKSWKIVVGAMFAMSLGGCAGGGNYYASQPGPNHPFANSALADEVFVDGTGPSSRQAGRTVRYQAAAAPMVAPAAPASRSRTVESEGRSDAVSGTTGARSQSDPNKPFSDAWWERERAEDARLKAKMNICRGC